MSVATIDSVPSHSSLKARVGDNLWALADQFLISGTNFLTMILVARGLKSVSDFGVFVLVYSILLFSNSIQMALITQPHNVLGESRRGTDYVRYTASTAFNQLVLVLVLASFVFGAWGIGLAILCDVFDHSLKSPEEIEEKLSLPLLVSIPHLDSRKLCAFERGGL